MPDQNVLDLPVYMDEKIAKTFCCFWALSACMVNSKDELKLDEIEKRYTFREIQRNYQQLHKSSEIGFVVNALLCQLEYLSKLRKESQYSNQLVDLELLKKYLDKFHYFYCQHKLVLPTTENQKLINAIALETVKSIKCRY
jgi:hypothetical protein